MKRLLDVEKTRRAYHADRTRNSTHRASLMVPELPGSQADVSFLNHFLLKRGYEKVACRVTAIDPDGARIVSRLVPVGEPRVYTIPLTGMVDEVVDSYQVEFFSADNLFIPFPAVMVNHRGAGFLNSVHAYNRVLNDVFEDDEINKVHQREAAIDVRCDAEAETFLVFHAGPQPIDGILKAELRTPEGRTFQRDIPVRSAKLCRTILTLSEMFPEAPTPLTGGVLKIEQPRQFLFYGRMLVGQRTSDGAFSANHSYYDCADFPEYWENDAPSRRLYPYMPGYDNILRFYPIMSPGELDFRLTLFDKAGRATVNEGLGRVATPDGGDLHASATSVARAHGLNDEDVSAFEVAAQPIGGKTPTRVNHQLVYTAGGLESSINISLGNPNVFTPPNKTGFSWGQAAVGGGVESKLGLVGMTPGGEAASFEARFYDSRGVIAERRFDIPDRSAAVIDVAEALGEALDTARVEAGDYVWYQISSARPDSNAIVASRHVETGHTAGEHAF